MEETDTEISGESSVVEDDYEEQQDGDRRYYGRKLVRKVYKDQLALNTSNTIAAWRENAKDVKNEMEMHMVRKVDDKTTSWSNWMTTPDKVKICILPEQPLPPMNYWTETFVNIPTPDSKFLTHIPQLGDELDKKNIVGEELLEMYDGKLHSDTDLDIWPDLSDNFNLISFIRVLMKINEIYGAIIFSETHHEKRNKRKSIRMPSAADLLRYYEIIQSVDEKCYVYKKPTLELLTKISEVVLPEFRPQEILKRYIQLAQRRNPEFDNIRTAPSNVDVEDAGIFSKEAQMDSYKSLFCRLCYKYACVEHTVIMTKAELTTMQSTVTKQRSETNHTKKLPNKSTTHGEKTVCDFEDCCKTNCLRVGTSHSTQPDKNARESVLRHWTRSERTLFTCHYDSFKDYCLVAKLLATKTCREVMEYHKLTSQLLDSEKMVHSKGTNPMGELASSETEASCTQSSSGSGSVCAENITDELLNDEDNTREICTFIPCCHENGVCNDLCSCVIKKISCETSCGCLKSCKNRFKGCVCYKACDSKRCPCYVANRECDPDLCKNCGSHEIDMDKMTCKNIALQRRLRKPLYRAQSKVSGYGAFAAIDINKGDFIDEYTAERISSNEAEKRGLVYDKRRHTFLFELTKDIVLDASRIGNICRFINSSKRPNCQTVKMNVRGEQRLAIRALKDIKKDEELFINYHAILFNDSKRKSSKRSTKYVNG